jgi:hypothetical protein
MCSTCCAVGVIGGYCEHQMLLQQVWLVDRVVDLVEKVRYY